MTQDGVEQPIDGQSTNSSTRQGQADRYAGIRRARMAVLIVALCCIAFDAVLAFLGSHHYLDDLKLPDKVFAFLFIVPGILGLVLLLVARVMFRMTKYR